MNTVALLAHPDDELMCAGTLARLARFGAVRLICLFDDERHDELIASADAIGCRVEPHDDIDEDTFVWSRRAVRTIEPWIGCPDLLISHRVVDDNTSHGHIGSVARTLARWNRMSLWQIDQTIPGGITDHPAPNLHVDISEFRGCKRAAIAAYGSQLDRYPGLSAAIEARDEATGWQVGVDAAEGFTVAKAVW